MIKEEKIEFSHFSGTIITKFQEKNNLWPLINNNQTPAFNDFSFIYSKSSKIIFENR